MNNNILPKHFIRLENDFLLDMLCSFGIKTAGLTRLFKIQTGGGKEEQLKFVHEDSIKTYRVYTTDEQILILTPDDQECVTILLYKENNLAVLHNMSYFKQCAREGLNSPGRGNKLLIFALNLIINKKDKYNIKRILLKDISFLYCKNCSHTVKLARLRTTIRGQPWYMKFNFLPYDPELQKPSENILKGININQKILKTFKTDKIDIIELTKQFNDKENIDYDLNEIKRLMDKYKLFKDFIERLVREFDKYCCLVEYILQYIYDPVNKIGLADFYGKTYYLDI
jgi:hypothetical protein